MSLIDELKSLDCNTEEAVQRFMNNSALYEKMLKKLPDAINDAPVQSFIEGGDLDTAVSNAHTLKGVTGNLSVTPLYNAYSEIVRLLREGKGDDAKDILLDILPIQEKIIDCINSH